METCLYYIVYVFIDQGEHDLTAATRRNEVSGANYHLHRHDRYGSRFIRPMPNLDCALIIVNFMSTYPQFARQEIDLNNFSI